MTSKISQPPNKCNFSFHNGSCAQYAFLFSGERIKNSFEEVGDSSTSWQGCLSLVKIETGYKDAKSACEAENSMLLEFWSEDEWKEVKNE